MGSPSSPDVPKPSRQERELIGAQTDLLRQAQALTEENIRQQNLLSPLLFEQFGIQPVFQGGVSPITPAEATTQPVNAAAGVFSRGPTTGALPPSGAPEDVLSPEGLRELRRIEGMGNFLGFTPEEFARGEAFGQVEQPSQEVQDFLLGTMAATEGQAGVVPADTIGQIAGFEQLPTSPEDLLRQDLERQLLERTQAALSGDLPVDPALERSIADREAQLRSQLFRQLGPGFATSSPGMEALSRFTRDVEGLRGSARRADLTTAAGLAEAATTGRERSRALNVAGIQDILGRQLGGAGSLGQVAQAFQSPIGQLANQRQMEFQSNLAQFQQPTTLGALGSLAGTLGGAFLGGPGSFALFPSLTGRR